MHCLPTSWYRMINILRSNWFLNFQLLYFVDFKTLLVLVYDFRSCFTYFLCVAWSQGVTQTTLKVFLANLLHSRTDRNTVTKPPHPLGIYVLRCKFQTKCNVLPIYVSISDWSSKTRSLGRSLAILYRLSWYCSLFPDQCIYKLLSTFGSSIISFSVSSLPKPGFCSTVFKVV